MAQPRVEPYVMLTWLPNGRMPWTLVRPGAVGDQTTKIRRRPRSTGRSGAEGSGTGYRLLQAG